MSADDDRLPAGLWIDSHLRKLAQEGIGAYVVNKGAWASGTILLKINRLGRGVVLYQQQRDISGSLGWMNVFGGGDVPEPECDSYIRRAIDRDPDLWVIEIEDREGKNPFEGGVF